MAEGTKTSEWAWGKKTDNWFNKLQKDITSKIGHFVAFFFLIIAAGIWAGIIVAQHYPEQAMLAVLLAAVAGLIAYFNRTFATIIFIIMILFVFFL